MWNTTTPWNCLQIVLGSHSSPHVVWQALSFGFGKEGEIPPFVFEKPRGFKHRQFGPFSAHCMCASASLLPQYSLRCESQRLEVSGPGGARCLKRPVEGGESFPASTCYLYQKPQDFYRKWKMWWKMSVTCASYFFEPFSNFVCALSVKEIRPR